MRRILTAVAFLLLLSPILVTAQEKLSPEAHKLSDALASLKATPDDSVVQEEYLNTFPHDYGTFLKLFVYGHELADGFDFIMVLPSLAKNHEAETGRILVQLSKDAHKEADAPTYLQMTTATYAAQYTKTFANLLQQLPSAAHANLVTFVADVENHAVYSQYQQIIDHMTEIEQIDLANEFKQAREKRSQRARR
jgi:hypothetical protein